MRTNNFLTKTIGGLFTLAIIFFVANTASAQFPNSGKMIKDTKMIKKSENTPKMIRSKTFKKEIKGNDNESIYSFEIDPGETVLDIKAKAYNDNVYVSFSFDYIRSSSSPVGGWKGIGVNTTYKGEGSYIHIINSDIKQIVYVKIKEWKYKRETAAPGNLTINFSGAFVEFAK